MDYQFRFWVTQDNHKVFGEGPVIMLKKVDELGSLRQAALSMGMSYSKAWQMIDRIETHLQIPILTRTIGGRKGGGSTITINARRLIQEYETIKSRIDKLIDAEMQTFLKKLSEPE